MWDHRLRVWLRFLAIVLGAAVFGALMPASWMKWGHHALGLHDFPHDSPITLYLARSVSGFYVFMGLVYWCMARDVRRYLPLIRLMGAMGMLAGVGFAVMDWQVGLPVYWAIVEGPIVLGLSAVTSYLARQAAIEELECRAASGSTSIASGTEAWEDREQG